MIIMIIRGGIGETEVLFNIQKEGYSASCNSMDGPGGYYAK